MAVVFEKKDMDLAAMTTKQRDAVGMYLRGEDWAEYVKARGFKRTFLVCPLPCPNEKEQG